MAQRNPPWVRDELILALDLYRKVPPAKVPVTHPAIVALSQLLKTLPIHPPEVRNADFRNANGVHMKMFNFQSLDPDVPGGLDAGSRRDAEVWAEFAGDVPRLRATADAIRAALQPSAVVPVDQVDDAEDEGVAEGRILLRLHRSRERNGQLVRQKKQAALNVKGKLACEVCGFVYAEVYGARGDGFIECHHTIPLAQSAPGQKTKLADLALVCANCHRMLHNGATVLTTAQLREIITDGR